VAKANRVISKPKPPAVKHLAIIDPTTGVISGYVSGTNVVLGNVESQRNWRDITNVPGAKQLSGKLDQKLVKAGVVKNKPRIRLKLNKREVDFNEEAEIEIEVIDGDPADIPEDIMIRLNGSKYILLLGEKLKIKGSKEKNLAIKVSDSRVFVEEEHRNVGLRIGKRPPPPPREDDGVVVRGGKAKGK
jgi:hypothetical protein